MDFRLKDFRETQKLFQSDMAAILELNQSTISRMELKQFAYLTLPQYKVLCERFGEEKVLEFVARDSEQAVVVANNTNEGSGTQDNSVTMGDATAMDIIRQQSKTLTETLRKQSEQTDRLLGILEKLTEKQP